MSAYDREADNAYCGKKKLMSHQVAWLVTHDGQLQLYDVPTFMLLKSHKTLSNSGDIARQEPFEGEYMAPAMTAQVHAEGSWLIISPYCKTKMNISSSSVLYFFNSLYLNGKYSSVDGGEAAPVLDKNQLTPYFKIITSEKWTAMAMTPDEEYFIAGSVLGKIFIWKLSTGNLMAVIQAHYQKIQFLRFTNDGGALVTGTADSNLKVWLFQDLLSAPRIMSSEATSEEALFVKDSSELLSIEPIVTLKGIHEKAMTDVTVSRGSRWFETVILTVSLDAHCKIFSLINGQLLGDFVYPEGLTTVLIDPLETSIIVGSIKGKIFVVSPLDNVQMKKTDRKADSTCLYFDETNHSMCRVLRGSDELQVTSLALTMDCSHLVSGDSLGNVHYWDLKSFVRLRTLKVSSDVEGPVAFVRVTCTPASVMASANSSIQQRALVDGSKPKVMPLKKQLASMEERAIVERN